MGYWPTLKIEEGYWVSAFSKREGIERIIKELQNVDETISVLWDAELPHLRRQLFITELPEFLGNRKIIQDFVAKPPENVTLYVAENRKRNILHKLFLRIFTVTFDPHLNYNRIEMLYGQLKPEALGKSLKMGIAEMGRNYNPVFGVTAEGIGGSAKEGSWMRISPAILDKQLSIAQKFGIKKVFIYRLGGLDQDYLKVIKKYSR